MSREILIAIGVAYYFITIIILNVVLKTMDTKEKNRYRKKLDTLERDKNLIMSASLIAELNKVEPLIKNENMKEVLNGFQDRFNKLKEEDISKVTDSLIEAEELFSKGDLKSLRKVIPSIELDIYYGKVKSNNLLLDIKEITLSEEKNRAVITRLKSNYRDILTKYKTHTSEYTLISDPLELQFENVDKLFKTFEIAMEAGSYQEVPKIVKGLDDLIGNLSLVSDEAPLIISMGKNVLPKKIEDVLKVSKKMEKDGYNLDYLKIGYNIDETSKKITDIFQRLNVLNIEDSLLELRTITDYFDSIMDALEKEVKARKNFSSNVQSILLKISKLTKINDTLLKKLKDIKYAYDLDDSEVEVVNEIKEELASYRGEYDDMIEESRAKSASYTHLEKEMELLRVKVSRTEEKLNLALQTLGSLKEDEKRAREQLEEMKEILNNTKLEVRSYKLPFIPNIYYVELSEAFEGIANIISELEKTPMSIKILNTRVDTARDLVLKVNQYAREMVKSAKMAEATIIYGNRYRPINQELASGLLKAEREFNKGDYKKSLESAIQAVSILEPNVYDKLLEDYK